MAKVTFEFDLDEDRSELQLFQSVNKLYFALDEIYSSVRNELKYSEHPKDEYICKLLERIKEESGIIHDLEG